MDRTIAVIDRINTVIARIVMWVAVLLAVIQFTVVILRYVFAIGFIPLQESIWYMHAVLFMAGAGFTLLADGHVRVDVFYREAPARTRATIDLLGGLVFLLPLCIATFIMSYPYVLNSWRIFEGSTETSGIQGIFLLKTLIWVFAILVGLQGIAMILRALHCLSGRSDDYRAAGVRGLSDS